MRKQELFIFIGIIVLVAVLFFVYAVVSLFTTRTTPPPSPTPSPIPLASRGKPFENIPSPQPSFSPNQIGEITKEGLINLLPIQTPRYNIEYLSGNDVFVVTIKQNPYEENRLETKEWFKSQGFNPDALKIYWRTYPEVEK